MKHKIIASMILAALLPGLSLTVSAEQHKYNYADFDRISVKVKDDTLSTTIFGRTVSSGNKNECTPVVNIVKGDEYRVDLDISDDSYVDICDVDLSGSELKVTVIYTKQATKANPKIEFTICTPVLAGLNAYGTCDVKTDGSFETPGKFHLGMSGAANLYGLNISAGDATLKTSGSSNLYDIDIVSEGYISINSSGASNLKRTNFKAEKTELSFSGSSKLSNGVLKSDKIELTFSGASNLSGVELSSDTIELKLSGSSRAGIKVDVRKGRFILSGASQASVSSLSEDTFAENVDITVTGSSKGKFSDLYAKNATVKVSGCSSASAYASDNLEYKVDSQSSFDYYGKPANINPSSSNVRAH